MATDLLTDVMKTKGKKYTRQKMTENKIPMRNLKVVTSKTRNKPDRATTRPDCVFAFIDHVTNMERQMDEQTGETTK